ncbi:MAG: hypothetical protein SZ59_C0002G0317 [candidate division TM6 bacterium GW2011_GWF2_28_16]|nr:MAG: hypothetical protein SZ59_C0002G0317 [candidate division TM6 bacterium GW2011_GWF2_28_16]
MYSLKKIIKKFLLRISPSWRSENVILQNNRYLREILFASVFNDSIRNVDWIKKNTFSPSGASVNYSFLYILFKILDFVRPKNILELGMGESSKLLFQYAYANKDSRLYCVDDNKFWMDKVKEENKDFNNDNINSLLLNLKEKNINNFKIKAYDKLIENLNDLKFNLILIDGPCGNSRYSRFGALELITNNLAQDFVIIVDDYDRKGEQDLAEAIILKLNELKINYEYCVYRGIKFQAIIYSKKFNYLETL